MIPQSRLNDCKCGGHAFQRKIDRRYQVYCHSCENATSFYDNINEAVKEWNLEVRYEAMDLYREDDFDHGMNGSEWWKGE